MADQTIIDKINTIIKSYFEHNATTIMMVKAKDLMPHFIAAGIFRKDEKHGLPIREFLRDLDRAEELRSIPYVYAERIDKNTNWYFVPSPTVISQIIAEKVSVPTKKEIALKKRLESDEAYVIDLCDTILGEKAERQKRFSFLLGDVHKDGITRTQLPVDAFYESIKLVVEYKEAQEIEANDDRETQQTQTLNGISRTEQRKLYDERRAEELPKNGITLLTIAYSDFNCDNTNKIIRNIMLDMEMVKTKLKDFLN
jgi:hypothetical protein